MNMLTEGFAHLVGKVITNIDDTNEWLDIHFSDDTYLRIHDVASYCCESRYMTCDDDYSSLYGQRLMRIEQKDVVELSEGKHDSHEISFLEIGTNFGFITIGFHNENNGYYCGFNVVMSSHQRILH